MKVSDETLAWIRERAAANEDIDANELLAALATPSESDGAPAGLAGAIRDLLYETRRLDGATIWSLSEKIAALAAPVAPEGPTCADCLRPVSEVDAETGECRECYDRKAAPSPDRDPRSGQIVSDHYGAFWHPEVINRPAAPDSRPVVETCPDCGRSDEHAAPCTAAHRVRLASYPPRVTLREAFIAGARTGVVPGMTVPDRDRQIDRLADEYVEEVSRGH